VSTVTSIFEQAQLSEAAYANFWNQQTNSLITSSTQVQAALEAKTFSNAQATEFVKHWKVVDQYDNSALGGLVGTGFSATVFESLDNPGHYSLAIRGSQGVNDFLADAALIANQGVAISQLVDMYNFWQRAKTPAGSTYQAAVLEPIGTGPLSNAIYISGLPYKVKPVDSSLLTDPKLQTGSGSLATAALPSIDVTGHSLGGHLAMAFTRLFPNANANAIAVNGLGFKLNNSTVNNLFAQLGGSSFFSSSAIQNVYGIGGPEFASMNNSVLQQVGAYDGIFIESASPLPPIYGGHSASQMTDSLAVYNLFAKVAPALGTDPNPLRTITSILKASSNVAANSLESAVSSLGELFVGTGFTQRTGSEYNTDRNLLYTDLQSITATLPPPLLSALSIKSFVTTLDNGTDIILSGSSLADSASAATPEGMAYRYALVEGNPFAVNDDKAVKRAA